MGRVQEVGERIVSNVENVIVGKPREVEFALVAMLCQGHILIEDIPGVGKTVLAKSFARSVAAFAASNSHRTFYPAM